MTTKTDGTRASFFEMDVVTPEMIEIKILLGHDSEETDEPLDRNRHPRPVAFLVDDGKDIPQSNGTNAPIQRDDPNKETLVDDVRPIPRPLRNGGNNCAFNTALQIMLSSKNYRRWIEKQRKNPKFKELVEFYDAYQNPSREPDSKKVREMLCRLCPGRFEVSSQEEDAHEVLMALLETYHKDGAPRLLDSKTLYYCENNPDLEMLDYEGNEIKETPITNEIQLPLMEHGRVADMIDEYFNPSNENKTRKAPTVQDEKEFRSYSTTKIYESAPPEIVVNLPRFRSSGRRVTRSFEIPQIIEIPTRNQNGSKPPKIEKYRLVALAHHFGETPHTGHYTADFYDRDTSTLYHFNDQVPVSQEPLRPSKNINSNSARFLVYEKEDEELESSPRGVRHWDQSSSTSTASSMPSLVDSDSELEEDSLRERMSEQFLDRNNTTWS